MSLLHKILPRQLPRHSSRHYFLIRLLTTILLFLSLIFSITLIGGAESLSYEDRFHPDYNGNYVFSHEELMDFYSPVFAAVALLLRFILFQNSLLDLYVDATIHPGWTVGLDVLPFLVRVGLIWIDVIELMAFASFNECLSDSRSCYRRTAVPLFVVAVMGLCVEMPALLLVLGLWFKNVLRAKRWDSGRENAKGQHVELASV